MKRARPFCDCLDEQLILENTFLLKDEGFENWLRNLRWAKERYEQFQHEHGNVVGNYFDILDQTARAIDSHQQSFIIDSPTLPVYEEARVITIRSIALGFSYSDTIGDMPRDTLWTEQERVDELMATEAYQTFSKENVFKFARRDELFWTVHRVPILYKKAS